MIKKSHNLSRNTQKSLYGYLFVLPFVIGLLVVYGKILIDSVLYSFFDIIMKDRLVMEWKGFSNYHNALFINPDFNRTVVESIGDMVFELPVILIFSLFIATILNQNMRGRGLFRGIFFIPVILSAGIIEKSEINNAMMNMIMNNSLTADGVQSGMSDIISALDMQNLLMNINISPEFTGYIFDLVNNIYDIVGKSGVQILIFLSGLQSISPAIYESADIEGASAWEKLWKITFPMISPMIFANLLYTVIDSFTRSDNEIMKLIQEIGFRNSNYGLSSAMSWIYSLVILLMIGLAVLLSYRLIFYQQKD